MAIKYFSSNADNVYIPASKMANTPNRGLMKREQKAMGQLSHGRRQGLGCLVITGRMYDMPDTVYVEYKLRLLPYSKEREPSEWPPMDGWDP